MYVPDLRGEYTALAGYGRCYSFCFCKFFTQISQFADQNTQTKSKEQKIFTSSFIYPWESQGILGFSLFGVFRYQCCSGWALFSHIWYLEKFPRKSKSRALHYCSSARTRSLPSLCFRRNVRRFRAIYVDYSDQVLLEAFFEAFLRR